MTDTRTKRRGLTPAEVADSARLHGKNVIPKKKRASFFLKLIKNLSDPVIRVLLCALTVRLICNLVFENSDWLECFGIAVSILLAALISTLSEQGGEEAFERLNREYLLEKCRVRRGGQITEIPVSDLVVGDVVLVSAGERIAADGLIIHGCVQVDQSALTGESAEREKKPSRDSSPLPDGASSMCSGCAVVSGEGEMTVTAVGKSTSLGKISTEIQADKRKSPLRIRLTKLAKQISVLGYIAAATVAVVFLLNAFVFNSGFSPEVIRLKLTDVGYVTERLLDALMLGLTVVVMAVPEGLPMMVAVVLSSNVRRMARDNVLVCSPVGIESAGSMNLLFTDKTGTLTHGRMTLEGIVTADGKSVRSVRDLSDEVRRPFELCALFNTSASVTPDGVKGSNGTDRALLEPCHARIGHYSQISLLDLLPFNSTAKYSAATVYDLAAKARLTFVKGAPERILPSVTECMRSDGSVVPFSACKTVFEGAVNGAMSDGARVLLIAQSVDAGVDARAISRFGLGRLRLICAVRLCDRVKKEARNSVARLHGAGVGVVMITGDGALTATHIARECGILTAERTQVLTSAELARLSDSEVKVLLPRLAVLARALPEDKSRLVRIAQSLDLVVGMTGDGINDAPALRLADVGFAMGSGTQIAKEAADVIILDNDLSSIVKAVLYGRTVFKSIRKFITLQLTVNLCAVAVSMIGPFIGVDAPVTVVQMLWINIIMDTLGGLAFAGEAPLDSYMKEAPKRRDEPILNGYMINEILLLGGATVAVLLTFLTRPSILRLYRTAEGSAVLLTAFFALFIFTGVFNCFNARTDRLNILAGLGKNPAFVGIMTAVLAVQLLFVYLGGDALRTVPLLASELRVTFLISLAVLPFETVRKLIYKLLGRRRGY